MMRRITFILCFFLIFLLICVASIGYMIVSMFRQGDERRREILLRAGCSTFYIMVGMIAIDIVTGIYQSIACGLPMAGKDPFVQLSVISFVYAISLAVYRRKYGG